LDKKKYQGTKLKEKTNKKLKKKSKEWGIKKNSIKKRNKMLRDKIEKKKQNQENDKKKTTTIKRMGIISDIKK